MAWRRRAARIVLLDHDDRVLLLAAHDPARPHDGSWWEIPGGGIDPGEDSAGGAARELYEETGMRAEVGPCVWTQRVQFSFGGYDFDTDDFIHVARIAQGESGEYAPTHLEFLEAAAFEGARWWALDEILASSDRFLPERLKEFLPAIVAGVWPDEPVDISPVQQAAQ